MYMIIGNKTIGKNAKSKNMNQNQGKLFVGITLVEQLAHVSIANRLLHS